jgi:transaldolase
VIPTDSIRGSYAVAQKVLDDLAAAGVDYDDVVDVLEREAVEKFEASWIQVLDAVQQQLKEKAGE